MIVTHTRDALGRITTLDREDGIYALYSGGGLRQSFTYTSKGELKTARTSQMDQAQVPTWPDNVEWLPGRSLELKFDGQGNRLALEVDGERSHTYTPNEANEYTHVAYGANAAAVSGTAVNPGRVLVGGELAVRQDAFFHRSYTAETFGQWLLENVFAAALPPPGQYATAYTAAQKEVRVPPAAVSPEYDKAGNLLADGQWTYEYDGNNRLIRMTSALPHPDGRVRELAFTYDYLGRRATKTVTARESSGPDTVLARTAFAYWEWHLLGGRK